MNTLRRIPRVLTRTVAAGAVMVAAALPMVAMSAAPAGAATGPTITSVTNLNANPGTVASVMQGTTGTTLWGNTQGVWMTITGTGFAFNGGAVTVTSNAAGVTFSGAQELSSTSAKVYVSASSTTAPGFYSLTVTDSNGAGTLANAFGVDPGPSITSVTPSSEPANTGHYVTIAGSFPQYSTSGIGGSLYLTDNFGHFYHVTNQVSVNAARTAVTAFIYSGSYPALVGSNWSFVWITYANGNPMQSYFPSHPQGYSNYSLFQIKNPFISNVTYQTGTFLVLPGAGPAVQQSIQNVTLLGSGFQSGALVSLSATSCGNTTISTGATFVNTTGTSLNFPVTMYTPAGGTTCAGPFQATVNVVNPDGSTATAVNAIGFGEAGAVIPPAPGSGTPAITNVGGNLFYGESSVLNVGTNNFPVTVGTTVHFDATPYGPSFTATVSAVDSSGNLTVPVSVPRYVSTTLSALTASSTTLPVANTAGLYAGAVLTIVDGTSTENVTEVGAPSTTHGAGFVTVSVATLHSHAAGTTVEFKMPTATPYLLSINNGSLLEGTTVTVAQPLLDSFKYLNTGTNVLGSTVGYGSSFTGTFVLPGFGFGAPSTVAFINHATGQPISGITGTVSALSADSANVNVSVSSTVTTPSPLVASNDSTSGALERGLPITTDTHGMLLGDTAAAFLTSSIGNVKAGSTVTAASPNNGPSQTFTVLSTSTGVGTSGAVTILNFSQPATFNIPAAAVWTSPDSTVSNPSGTVDVVVLSGTGNGEYYTSFTLAGVMAVTGIRLHGTANTTLTLGQGASGVPVDILGSGFPTGGLISYTASASEAGVTFSGCTWISATEVDCLASVTGTAAVNANVQVTLSAGVGGSATSLVTTPILSIIAAPVITSVANAGTFTNGEFGQVTVFGAGLAGATVSFIPTSGENAGMPDSGTLYGHGSYSNSGGPEGNGVYQNGPCVATAGSITCPFYVDNGASNGAYKVMVTLPNSAGGGSAVSSGTALTVSAPTVTSITPTSVPRLYSGTFTVNTTGMGLSSGSTPVCYATLIDPVNGNAVNGGNGQLGNCVATYLSPTSESITISSWTASGVFGGDSIIFTLQSASGQLVDTPAVSIMASTHVWWASAGALIQGSTRTVTVTGDNFYPGMTLFYSGTGVTVTTTSLSPQSITATVVVAGNATTGGSFYVGNTQFNNVVPGMTVAAGPSITAVNGVSVLTVPFSALAGSKTTLVITGTGFAEGAVVTSGVSGFATFGTAVVSNFNLVTGLGTTITVPVTFTSFSGPAPISSSLIVTNPAGYGAASVANELALNPLPAITGGPYYVPTFTTNMVYLVTGTGFESGMTVSSSNAAYTVQVVGTTPTTASLLVSTTSAATAGTSSTLTFTNPDGGTVSFALNGGPAPVNAGPLAITGVAGYGKRGQTRAISILGTGFLATVSIASGRAGVTFQVVGVSPNAIRVLVKVAKNAKPGMVRLVLTNGTGGKTSKPYLIK